VFDSDASGQAALARPIPLPTGRYHLVAIVNDTASGAIRRSTLAFAPH
jgi:hypothetical protein